MPAITLKATLELFRALESIARDNELAISEAMFEPGSGKRLAEWSIKPLQNILTPANYGILLGDKNTEQFNSLISNRLCLMNENFIHLQLRQMQLGLPIWAHWKEKNLFAITQQSLFLSIQLQSWFRATYVFCEAIKSNPHTKEQEIYSEVIEQEKARLKANFEKYIEKKPMELHYKIHAKWDEIKIVTNLVIDRSKKPGRIINGIWMPEELAQNWIKTMIRP